MSVEVRKKVAYRLTRNTIFLTTILGFFYVGSLLLFDLNVLTRDLEQRAFSVGNPLIPQAKLALLNNNMKLSEAVLDSIIQNSSIYKARLLDRDYRLIAQREQEPLKDMFSDIAIWFFGENKMYALPISLKSGEDAIGQLELSVDRYAMTHHFLSRFLVAVILGLIYFVLLGGLFLIQFNYSVGRSLNEMIVWFSRIKLGSPSTYNFKFSKHRDDELQHLVDLAHSGLDVLVESVNKSRIVENKLNHHKDNLEKMVQARTDALSELNRKFGNERFQAKLLAMEAQRARWDSEKANQDKTRFLAAASHDLRQPLHAIALFAEALEPHVIDSRGQLILKNLNGSLTTMKQLFNTLLDISKLEAGVLTPHIKDFSLQKLFQRLETVYSAQALDKRLWFKIKSTNSLVRSDPDLLEQVLSNLLSNAIKYTENGGVLVYCKEREGKVLINIRDTGEGIKAEDQQRVFDEFVQLHNVERDRSKGLGLGMAIVKRTSDLLGHKITLKSELDRGTVFVIQVPVGSSVEEEKPLEQLVMKPMEGKRVLVLDDDPSILLGMKSVLESWQLQPIIAQTMDEAISLVSHSAISLDLIISDLSLAENLNGIEAIYQLQEHLAINVPGILITGENNPERIRMVHDTPFPLLHKPIKPAQLRTLCRSILTVD